VFGHLQSFKVVQIYLGFSLFSDHIYSSGLFRLSHINHSYFKWSRRADRYFVEQATYTEWLNSSYPGGKNARPAIFLYRMRWSLRQIFSIRTEKTWTSSVFGEYCVLSLMNDHKNELGL
jgi:hypothetical protein